MTIDSSYIVKFMDIHDGTEYQYRQESIGVDALQLWVGTSEAGWTQLDYGVDFAWTLGGFEPMYPAAVATFTEPLDQATGNVLFMRRTPITNDVVFADGEEFDGNKFEYAIDKLTMILQEIDGHKSECRESAPTEPGGSKPPECLPYDCNAYYDYLMETEGQVIVGWSTETPSTIPFQFSTSWGDGKLQYVYNIISSPQLITAYGVNPSTNSLAPSTSSIAHIEPPDFCGEGLVQHLICINHNPAIGPDCILPGSGYAAWGSHQVEALMTGINGTNVVSGVLLRNLGKRWNLYYSSGSGPNEWSGSGSIRVAMENVGNDLKFTARIENSEGGYPNYIDSITIPDGAIKLTRVVASVESGELELIPDLLYPPAVRYGIFVRLKVEAGGQSLTVEGYNCSYVTSAGVIVATEVPHSPYTLPWMFTDAQCSVASIVWKHGGFADTSVQSKLAYDRTFENYTPPGYC